MCFWDTHVGNYGAIALDDVRAVMTLQHHIQVHEDPLVLILVSCPTHLLETQKKRHLIFLPAVKHISTPTMLGVHVKKLAI